MIHLELVAVVYQLLTRGEPRFGRCIQKFLVKLLMGWWYSLVGITVAQKKLTIITIIYLITHPLMHMGKSANCMDAIWDMKYVDIARYQVSVKIRQSWSHTCQSNNPLGGPHLYVSLCPGKMKGVVINLPMVPHDSPIVRMSVIYTSN